MLIIEDSARSAQILTISGRFDENNTVALETALQRAENRGAQHIIFNLEKVSSLNSSGIGTIFLTYYRLQEKGIRLSLVNPTPEVRQLLEFVELPRLIPIFDFNEEAVSQLKIPLPDTVSPKEHKHSSDLPAKHVPKRIRKATSETSA